MGPFYTSGSRLCMWGSVTNDSPPSTHHLRLDLYIGDWSNWADTALYTDNSRHSHVNTRRRSSSPNQNISANSGTGYGTRGSSQTFRRALRCCSLTLRDVHYFNIASQYSFLGTQYLVSIQLGILAYYSKYTANLVETRNAGWTKDNSETEHTTPSP